MEQNKKPNFKESFVLNEKHKQKAIQLIKQCQITPFNNGKKCTHCDGNGVFEFEKETNCVRPCKKCVSLYPLWIKWLAYLKLVDPALYVRYKASKIIPG